jgi:outer membrane protein OmpA-like peptidoglycan-associated protein
MAVSAGDFTIHITGYTDNVGTAEINKTLSEKRADAVAKYLFELGLPRNIVTQTGLGSENPISSNNTPEGRTKNRRVEIKFNYNA